MIITLIFQKYECIKIIICKKSKQKTQKYLEDDGQSKALLNILISNLEHKSNN